MKLVIIQRVALDRTVPIAIRNATSRSRRRTEPRLPFLRLLARTFP